MTSTDIINTLIGLLEKYKAHVAELSQHLPPASLPQHAQLQQATEDLHAEATDAVSAAKEHVAPPPFFVPVPPSSSSSDSSLSSAELQALADQTGLPIVGPNGEVTHSPGGSLTTADAQQGA